jgi:serine protease Do
MRQPRGLFVGLGLSLSFPPAQCCHPLVNTSNRVGGFRQRMNRVLAAMLLTLAAEAVGADAAVPPFATDDHQIAAQFQREAEALLASGQTIKLVELTNQLGRASTQLKLARSSRRPLSADEMFRRTVDSTVIVGRLFKCTNCPHWHVNPASGFALTGNGAVVTSHHVVADGEGETIVVMRRDGKVFPITSVLAADARADLAVLQAAGSGFRPLPIGNEPPVGTTVRVISHPDGRFFTLTEGIVSRYFQRRSQPGSVTLMAITADFARGSSGGPVLDTTGAVVGVVQSTQTINYHDKDGKVIAPQMVVKNVVPVRYLRALVGGPSQAKQ